MSEFTVLVSDDRQRAAIGGEIDIASADQLDAALAGLSGDIDVDCTEVKFIGAPGFYSLDRGYKAALAAGATSVVSGMSIFQRRLATILSVPYVL
jgi:anti-anti-sigma regulatory factor